MKKNKALTYSVLLMLLVLVVALTGCDSWDLFGAKKCHRLDLSTAAITTDVAEAKTWTVSATTYDKSNKQRSGTSIVWSFSSPEKISVLHKSGDSITFVATDPGRIVLTAYDDSNPGITKAVIITATGTLKGIYLDKNNVTLDQRQTDKLTITFSPTEPSNKDVVWTSSDTSVVQVTKLSDTEAQLVSGNPGTATVTVQSTSNSAIKATCQIKVSDIYIPPTAPRYLRLSSAYMEFNSTGASENLTATVYDGTNSEVSAVVKWSSSNPAIVSVPTAGKSITITPRAIGTAIITATMEDNETITGSCEVNVGAVLTGLTLTKVANDTVPTGRSFRAASDSPQVSGTYPIGQTVTYKVSYLPATTTQTGVLWTADSDVVSISPNGDYVTVKADKAGNTRVRATSRINPDISADAAIGVYDPAVDPDNNISRIVLDPYKLSLIAGGSGSSVAATVHYQDGSSGTSDLVWSADSSCVDITPLSSDNCLVDVTPVSAGLASVTATALANPYVSAKASVYVGNPGDDPDAPQMLAPSTSSVTLVEGKSIDITVSYLPVDPASATIAWQTKDSNVATVTASADGLSATVTAGSAGTTTITATSTALADRPATITVKVVRADEVQPKVSSVVLSDSSLTLDPPFMTDQSGLTARSYDAAGNVVSDTYTWTIDRPGVISGRPYNNTKQYILTPLVPGTAKVTVRSSGNPSASDTSTVTATGGLRDIRFSPETLKMAIGESASVSATLIPAATVQQTVQWTISGDAATMTRDPINPLRVTLKGSRAGTANLTLASRDNPDVVRTMEITISPNVISPYDPHYLMISKPTITFGQVGQNQNLTATIYDGNNTEMSGVVNWTSSDPSVAVVTPTGSTATISSRAVGETTVTATLDGHGDVKAQCQVYVGTELRRLILEQVEQNTSRSLRAANDAPQVSGTYPIGQTVSYKVSYLPATTTQTGVIWTSDNSDAVSISAAGDYVTVTARGAGTARVTATSLVQPDISAGASLGVYDQSVTPDNNISRIVLQPNKLSLTTGGSDTVSATVYYQDGSSGITDLIWSSDSSMATVAPSAVHRSQATITGHAPGLASVTATTLANPYVSSKVSVLVSNAGEEPTGPQVLVPSADSVTLVTGQAFDIDLVYLPVDPADASINWQTANASIATVLPSSDGLSARVTADSAGDTTITAISSALTGKPASVKVKVVTPEEVLSRVSRVVLSDNTLVLEPPYTADQSGLTATSYDSAGNVVNDTYPWTIDRTNILSGRAYNNTKQYILTPLVPGTAKVTVQSTGNPNAMATADIEATGGLQRIMLSPDTLKLSIGSTVSISASLDPANTVQSGITWSISGDAVQLARDMIDPYKVQVKGLKAGSSVLKATSSSNPLVSQRVEITVLDSQIPPTSRPGSISLSQTTVAVAPPITTPAILTATVYDQEGLVYPIGVSWSIEDPSIAELTTTDQERVSIVAKKAGETRIIATSIVDPSITKTCILTVSGKITRIIPEQTYIQLVNGNSTELKVSLQPINTIETDLIWETEGTTDGSTPVTPWVTLRPTASGCLVTGIKTGATTVTVRSKVRPEVYAEIAVEVTDPPKVMATITISPTPVELSPDSKRTKVLAKVTPVGNIEIGEEVVFRVDPASLVDTTSGGTNEIYLIPNGTAGEGTIYASLPSYPHIEAGKARLFVGGQLRSLVANGAQSVAINVGDVAQIGVTYNPENTTERGVVWTSSNDSVARVNGGSSQDAIVTGISSGVATITAASAANSSVKPVEFTVVVKSIIQEVAFTDQHGNKGLIFSTDTADSLTLTCKISPDIERKLIYKPKSGNVSLAKLSGIDGTINDVYFTPDASAAGLYEYNITYDDRVVGVLSINTTFEGIGISSTREVFTGDYQSCQLKVTAASGDVPDDQLTWRSSDDSVATVDKSGTVRARNPGSAIISATVGGGMRLVTQVYVNVDLPPSFEQALRQTGYLPFGGDTILPEHLDKITTLDLRQVSKDLAVDLSGLKKLVNLESLYISGISLASPTLSLSGCNKLKFIEANGCNITGLSAIPSTLETLYASDNLIQSYSGLSNGHIVNLNLSNNRITSMSDLTFAENVDLSYNHITSLRTSSERIKSLDVSDNNITSVNVVSRSLISLNLSSNDLTYANVDLNSTKHINTPSLEVLNLSNNKLGLYAGKTCPTCEGRNQAANATTYSETESQNREQPLRSIRIDWLPNLKDINLSNNHLRAGLSAGGKTTNFIISAPNLQKINIQGNHIGNNYAFVNRNGTINRLPASSTYNANGMSIVYDQGGCFHTARSWYDYWDWFLQHKTGWSYWITTASMY